MKYPIVLSTEWNIRYGGAENVNMVILDIFLKQIEVRTIWNANSNLEPTRQSVIRFFKFLPKSAQGLMSLPYHLAGVPKNSKLLISSSFMFSHLSRIRGGGRHLVYVHTPIRYIWNPEIDNRAGRRRMLFHFVSWLVKSTERRFLDREAIFIANSAEVKNRILKYWGVESEVIHPPVDVSFFSQYLQPKSPENVCLISAGRFVPYKKLEQVIELARLTGLPLILAGSGPQEQFLRNLADTSGAKVHFEDQSFARKISRINFAFLCLPASSSRRFWNIAD